MWRSGGSGVLAPTELVNRNGQGINALDELIGVHESVREKHPHESLILITASRKLRRGQVMPPRHEPMAPLGGAAITARLASIAGSGSV